MSDEKKTEELHVWDFDGTLVNTPVPDTGRAQYESETGLPWPHKGWWGRAESLEHPLTWSAGPAMDEFMSAGRHQRPPARSTGDDDGTAFETGAAGDGHSY